MSYTITDAEIRKFDADVKGIYQANAVISSLFDINNAGGSSTYQITRRGRGIGTAHVPGAEIPGMGTATEKTIITLQDYDNAEYVDDFQRDHVNWDELAVAAKEVCAPAAGRRADQIIIDALDAATVSEIAADFGSAGTDSGMTLGKVNRALTILSKNAVPPKDRLFLAPFQALETMLSTEEFVSKDYVNQQLNSAQEGKIVRFGGFNWYFVPDNPEGGISYTFDGTNNIFDCYAVHKKAVGVAAGMRNMAGSDTVMTKVERVPNKGSWIVNAPLSFGASVIETEGVVRVKAAVSPIS